MKLIVAGSRGFHRINYLKELELAIHEFEAANNFVTTEIVHGGNMQSADYLGWVYGAQTGLPVKVFNADWDAHGKRAGILRNIEQGEYGDGLVTLWDGLSPGTKHMQDFMKSKSKPVYSHIIPLLDIPKKPQFNGPLMDVTTTIKTIK